ncbi:MAG: acetyltransferase [Planctomycetota bacterium]
MRTTATTVTPNDEPRRCLIVGCGGHGRVVLDILRRAGAFDPVGFADSNPATHGRRIDGLKVLGHPDDLPALRTRLGVERAIIAIGDNGVRRAFADQLQTWGFELVNAIHPSANFAGNVSLGRNTVVAAGVLVCAHCQIGDSVILNTGCIVDHETLVGTATHICPGARVAGRVIIEPGAFIGIGATIIQSIRVGYEAVVGAGAVVISDVAPMSTVVGVPARQIKSVHKTADMHAWLVPELSHRDASDQPVTARSW